MAANKKQKLLINVKKLSKKNWLFKIKLDHLNILKFVEQLKDNTTFSILVVCFAYVLEN